MSASAGRRSTITKAFATKPTKAFAMKPSPDYEAQYDNRARVPEHPAIIAGWARDAAAYRDANRLLVIPYGPSERQQIDVFRPESDTIRAVVVFIHGGYWQGLDRSFFSHLAR